jgi:hypothetical protein
MPTRPQSPPDQPRRAGRKGQGGLSTHFNTKQQVFLDFVLSHHVRVGVEELDQEKLTPLLRLMYHTPSPMRWPIWEERRKLDGSSEDSRSTSMSGRPWHSGTLTACSFVFDLPPWRPSLELSMPASRGA